MNLGSPGKKPPTVGPHKPCKLTVISKISVQFLHENFWFDSSSRKSKV